MANSIPDPIVFPDVDRIFPDEVVRASDWAPLNGLANAALAYVGVGPVIQQTWYDGISHQGAALTEEGEDIPVCEWRIPIPSAAHLTLDIDIRGRRTHGSGTPPAPNATVTFEAVTADASVTLDLPAIAGWVSDTLDIDIARDRADERVEVIRMYMNTGDDWVAEMFQVAIEIRALSSPLASSLIDGASPLGTTLATADYPLSTPQGYWLRDVIFATKARPLCGLCWSGTHPAYEDLSAYTYPHPGVGLWSHAPWRDLVLGMRAAVHVRLPGTEEPEDPLLDAVPVQTALVGGIPSQESTGWYSQFAYLLPPSFPSLLEQEIAIAKRVGDANVTCFGFTSWIREGITVDGLPAEVDDL